MHLSLKSGSTGRRALTALLIFSFITAFLTDVNVHVAHSNPGHSALSSSAIDYSPSLAAFMADNGPFNQDGPPSQSTLEDAFHGCLGFLSQTMVCGVFQTVRYTKQDIEAQRMVYGLHARLERPPRTVS
jgi:hypothetical protein